MKKGKQKFVVNIKDWDLPALDDLQDKVVDMLAKKRLAIYLDADTLGEQLYKQLFDDVRKLAAAAANEIISCWLEGLAGGNGDFPELCLQFPYLRGEAVEPLMIAYIVGAEDGSAAEVNRINLKHSLLIALEREAASGSIATRSKALAKALKDLAGEIEDAAAEMEMSVVMRPN